MRRPCFVIGVDLGCPGDHTAVAVVDRSDESLAVVHLDRLAKGMNYLAIADYVAELAGRPELVRDGRKPKVALGVCGVGKPIVDLFLGGKLAWNVTPVTATGGQAGRKGSWEGPNVCAYWVPMADLVGLVRAALDTRRLKVAPALPLAAALRSDMLTFRADPRKAEGEAYGSDSRQCAPDLVLAVAAASYLADKQEVSFAPFVIPPPPREPRPIGY